MKQVIKNGFLCFPTVVVELLNYNSGLKEGDQNYNKSLIARDYSNNILWVKSYQESSSAYTFIALQKTGSTHLSGTTFNGIQYNIDLFTGKLTNIGGEK